MWKKLYASKSFLLIYFLKGVALLYLFIRLTFGVRSFIHSLNRSTLNDCSILSRELSNRKSGSVKSIVKLIAVLHLFFV